MRIKPPQDNGLKKLESAATLSLNTRQQAILEGFRSKRDRAVLDIKLYKSIGARLRVSRGLDLVVQRGEGEMK